MNKATLEHRLNELMEVNLTNEQFGVEELASNLGYSRSHLHGKLPGRPIGVVEPSP